jgi:OmpR family response regulator RpaB
MILKFDGYSICRHLRVNSDIPIIIMTNLGDFSDRITSLEIGADDFISKPFSMKEFEFRVKSILRRGMKVPITLPYSNSGCLCFGKIKIDLNKRQVYKKNNKVRLTGMEFSLLELLISRSGEAFSRASILEEVWGYKPERHVDTRVVDVHVSRLRSKLENDPSNPDLILTSRGIGYLFQKVI